MNNLTELWRILQQKKSVGLIKQLYNPNLSLRVFAIFQYPENVCGIAFSFSRSIDISVSSLESLAELKISVITDTTFDHSQLLMVQLLDNQFKSVFAALCEDLIQTTETLSSEDTKAKAILNQLNRWKNLFEQKRNTCLSLMEQQGLFGELHFLEILLKQTNISKLEALNYWVGTEAALRDFQGNNWAIEIKTTSTNNPQKIKINGERQLDESFFEELYLFHVSVETSKSNGESLNQKVYTIFKLLNNDVQTCSLFEMKLFQAGYVVEQAEKYDDKFYEIRKEQFYSIFDNFPRIKEDELRDGVCEVNYSIILSNCKKFIVPQETVLKKVEECQTI